MFSSQWFTQNMNYRDNYSSRRGKTLTLCHRGRLCTRTGLGCTFWPILWRWSVACLLKRLSSTTGIIVHAAIVALLRQTWSRRISRAGSITSVSLTHFFIRMVVVPKNSFDLTGFSDLGLACWYRDIKSSKPSLIHRAQCGSFWPYSLSDPLYWWDCFICD